jgi:hypothetical protein
VQTIAVPTQTWFTHTSFVVQASLSLQVAPLALPTHEVQVGSSVPAQTPFVQTSVNVQTSLSLQAVPFDLIGLLHTPAVQVPISWHWSEAVQTIAVPPHTPLVQTSDVVHALLSLQVVPFVLIGLLHTPAVQVPISWH